MPPLKNQQHELFCLALLSGMSQQDAYIEAGYDVATARICASRLLTKANIIKRRGELSAITTTKAVMPVTARRERLSEIAREAIKQPVTAKEAIMSIDTLNKMDKLYTEPLPTGDIVQNFVFILPDGTKVLPSQLGKRKELGSGEE